jgi:hypothetical protein
MIMDYFLLGALIVIVIFALGVLNETDGSHW